MNEFEQYLIDIVENPKYSEATHVLANITLEQWRQGITPSGKTLEILSKSTTPAPPCSRVQYDGSCGWLRKYGAGYKLFVPPVGQRAICSFQDVFDKCPGYRRMK
jgi:hypothetical protein